MSGDRKRVVVLVSGRGSNMEALVRASAAEGFPAGIVGVVSDNAEAGGLAVAGNLGIAAVAVPRKGHADKFAHEAVLGAAIDRFAPDILCLAGYMRLLSGDFIRRYRGRIINIHPSLLPLFPGLETHRRAIEAGMRVHGCTVHFVTEAMDEGPIIAQAAVPLLPGDTPDGLAARVLAAEHRLYPQALAMLARGDVAMGADGRSRFRPSAGRGWTEGEVLLSAGR